MSRARRRAPHNGILVGSWRSIPGQYGRRKLAGGWGRNGPIRWPMTMHPLLVARILARWLAITLDTHVRDLATHCARGLLEIGASQIRGRRECRMRAAPAVSCAMCTRRCAHEHTGQRRTSDIPCAMALRLITCSPRRTALLPPLRPEKQLPPGALTPAPRRQDHTSLPYASGAVVTGSIRVHRIPVPRS